MDVISTAEVPSKERFALWREVSAKMWVPLDARCDRHLEDTFGARAGFSRLGPVQATVLSSTALSIHRTPRLIRQFDPEVFLVTCVVRGRASAEQDGRCARLGQGDLVLRDSSRPYLTRIEAASPDTQTVVLQFPRAALPLPERDLRELMAVRIPGDRGIGALSSHFLAQLAWRVTELSAGDAARLSSLTLDLLTAALAHELDAGDAIPPPTRHRALLVRIHAFIEAHLGDPALTPGAIAQEHHISLRYLHKLFRAEGRTLAGWIRRRRLERCRHDLADPRMAAHSVTAIAARWGFLSPTHFSQVFRSAYGLPPSQYRRQIHGRGEPGPAPPGTGGRQGRP